jgi:hypothetical protein
MYPRSLFSHLATRPYRVDLTLYAPSSPRTRGLWRKLLPWRSVNRVSIRVRTTTATTAFSKSTLSMLHESEENLAGYSIQPSTWRLRMRSTEITTDGDRGPASHEEAN